MQSRDESEAVARANLEFYRAFESLDIRRMEAIWARDETARCIHPNWPLCSGWPAVRDSWSRIFNNTASIQFEVSDIEITLGGAAAAWVVCIETLTVPSDDGPQSARMLATNIFRRAQTAGASCIITPRRCCSTGAMPRPSRSPNASR
jgi:ketosteroid isomerase-like protein